MANNMDDIDVSDDFDDFETKRMINRLLDACDNGNVVFVRSFIKQDQYFLREFEVSDDHVYVYSPSPLCRSAAKGHLEIVRLLLDNGSDVTRFGPSDPGSALACACKFGHLETIKLLLDRGGEINLDYGERPLANAARAGHVDVARLLLDRGADINSWKHNGRAGRESPLANAARAGHVDVARLLLDRGADVNDRYWDRQGSTALDMAAIAGHVDIARLLLDRGADIHHKDRRGHTALNKAAEAGHVDIARLLLHRGVNFLFEMVQLLIPEKTNIDDYFTSQKPHTGMTLLSESAKQLLLDCGADIEHQDKDGMTPLLTSIKFRASWSVTKLLLDHGANINHQNSNGDSALHFLIASPEMRRCIPTENCRLATVQLLLERGADINLQNKDGVLPLDTILGHSSDESHQIVHLFVRHAAAMSSETMSRIRQIVLAPTRNQDGEADQIEHRPNDVHDVYVHQDKKARHSTTTE